MKAGGCLMDIGFFSELLLVGTWYVYLETAPPDTIEWMLYLAAAAYILVIVGFFLYYMRGRSRPPDDE